MSDDVSHNKVSTSQLIPMIDLILSIASLEAAIWFEGFAWRSLFVVCAVIFLWRCLVLYALPSYKAIGRLRSSSSDESLFANSAKARFAIIAASILIAILFASVFYFLDLWSPTQLSSLRRSLPDWVVVKIPTVIVQQLLFQLVIIPTVLFLSKSVRVSVFTSAVIFGFLHLPNPVLMLLTTMVSCVWFALVFRCRCLVAITASHLILAVAIGNIAEEFVFDMRVGPTCFQKWPTSVSTVDSSTSYVVYPRLLAGEVRSITQIGNQVELRGIAFDNDRNKPPAEVIAAIGAVKLDSDDAKTWRPEIMVVVAPSDVDGNFAIKVNADDALLDCEIRIFARHSAGWTYPIHGSVRISTFANELIDEKICLYPKEIRGNIGHLKVRNNHVDVIGWAFSSKQSASAGKSISDGQKVLDAEQELISELLIYSNQRLVPISFERRHRPEIAKFHSDPKILNCGIVARLQHGFDLDRSGIYVKNSTGVLERVSQHLQTGHRRKQSHQMSSQPLSELIR